MENSCEVDDQGSGWFEVKKKHRSSSKFSLQSWVGGLSGKKSSNSLHSQHLLNKNATNDRCMSDPTTSGGSYSVRTQISAENSIPSSIGDNGGSIFPDKCMVKDETEYLESSSLLVKDSLSGIGDSEKNSHKDRPDIVHKIKWGDLEDDGLVLNNNANGVEIKFGNIREIDLVTSTKNEAQHDLISHVSSSLDSQVNKLVTVTVREEVSHPASISTNEDELCKVSDQDLNKKSIEGSELLHDNETTSSLVNDYSNCVAISSEHNKPMNDQVSSFNSSSCEKARMKPKVEKVVELPEVKGSEIYKAPDKDGMSSSLIIQDAEKVSTETGGPENSSGTSDHVEDAQHGSVTHTDKLNGLVVSVPSEGETGESKERFRQRLWCFLFENLNRAVDELYLLCELECDLEQMKEGILVLEEAASDFKELNARVEEFEEVKKLSSQSLDEVPITLKGDHRRPHALSWEVRRMTTSPHKAEILSSSLEAFKKIQQERASILEASKKLPGHESLSPQSRAETNKTSETSSKPRRDKDSALKTTQSRSTDYPSGSLSGEEKNVESISSNTVNLVNGRFNPQNASSSSINASKPPLAVKFKKEQFETDLERSLPKRERTLTEGIGEKNQKAVDPSRRQATLSEKDKEKEKRNMTARKSLDAWKEKRNWEDILSSSVRISSRVSHLPGMNRKSTERVRVLHDKLMSPDKRKKTSLDMKREAEEKHARAMKIRSELENERVQKLQRTSEKLNRVNEWQAVRTMKLREGMYARHQRGESRHEAFLAQVVKRAGDESSKVNEVRFITSLNEENKKIILRQKLHGSELRRAEKLQVMKTKQKEDMAREEAVLERKKLIEAEKLQRLAETQRKKEEAHVRREEERKASSAAREARAMEQLRRKEERAKAQQEEAELMAHKLAERLSESEQRRKFYLEQIRERAPMDFRDQSSPLPRRYTQKDGSGRLTPTNNCDGHQPSSSGLGSGLAMGKTTMQQQHMKRRIKRIRQRLMALKYEFLEPTIGAENVGIGYRTSLGTARAKIGRWLQELQKLRQARKEGAVNLGLIISEMIKYLEGRELELQASRQAGLLDFIASALPASHTSKPEACQVMIHLLKLLRVVLSASANRSYFLAQNLLPPIIPMLSTALENYIKIAASNGPTNVLPSSKATVENFDLSSEVLDGSLWTITTIIGHVSSEGRQLHMWDGLLELLIAYQVIHRLRDLFALYDRPQVEGFPMPSSILSSIRLLVVITSRPGTNCTINCISLATETLTGDESRITISSEFADFFGTDSGEGSSPSLSTLNSCKVVQKLKIAIDKLQEESCKRNKNDDLISVDDCQREQTDHSIDASGDNIVQASIQDEPQNCDIILKPFASHEDEKQPVDPISEERIENITKLKPPVAYLLSSISDTDLVGLLSLLTAVLLQANNRLSSEQGSYVLPSNFEDVATGVLKVLNNLALLDLKFVQRMLARPDLKTEFFHLMSFLLSHCTSKWTASNDPIGLLLLESLLILGHFALFHSENQAVLRWGNSPTILHKVCDLPFVFFSDPELMPVLASTLVAACYGCEQNKTVVQQELSIDMLLSLLRSCKNNLPATQSILAHDNDESSESKPNGLESRKSQMDGTAKSSRNVSRTGRMALGRPGGPLGNSNKSNKIRNQRDNKSAKTSDEMISKHNQAASEAASVMLHYRFPSGFIDRAEQFFSAGIPNAVDE